MSKPEEIAKSIMFMEYLGIHVESVNEDSCYFSVPKSSSISLNTNHKVIEHKIKESVGLIEIAKNEIMEMLNISDIDDYKFYIKIRDEFWSNHLGDMNIKKIASDINNIKYKYNV